MSILSTIITNLIRSASAVFSSRPEAIDGPQLATIMQVIDDNLDPLVATPAKATGTITLTADFLAEFNKYIEIGDGIRTIQIPVVNQGGTQNFGYKLDTGGGMSLAAAGARLQAIIEGYFDIAVTRNVGVLELEHRRAGVGGNVTITTDLVNVTVEGMSGGVGPDPFYPANPGSALVFGMPFAQQPTTGNTVTIGADVYQFITAGGEVTSDTRIGVAIGGDAAATLANWVAAINATYADNEHPNLLKGDGETPALANGTEPFFADIIGTTLRVRSAAAAGSSKIVGSAKSVVLAENLTHASLVWGVGNVNVNTLGGSYPSAFGVSVQSKAITQAMIDAGEVRFSFPFRVAAFTVQIRTFTHLLRDAPGADKFEIDNGDVLVTLTETDATDIDANDIVTVFASAY